MGLRERQGLFNVIDSFAIKNRNEFYLIGSLTEGEVNINWFVHVPLNKTLDITFRILGIEDIEFSNGGEKQKLLILNQDLDGIEFLLGLNIGSEPLGITSEGQD